MNSRGCNPRWIGRECPGPGRVELPGHPPQFDPSRVGSSFAQAHRGLHPRLFTFKPCGLASLPENVQCSQLRCAPVEVPRPPTLTIIRHPATFSPEHYADNLTGLLSHN